MGLLQVWKPFHGLRAAQSVTERFPPEHGWGDTYRKVPARTIISTAQGSFPIVSRMEAGMSASSFQLNTGNFIPAIGIGTVNLSSSSSGTDTVKEAVLSAIKTGYRHIDTASRYNSEVAIGHALQQAFREGWIKREDVFITTKVWADKLTPEGVLESIEDSLRNLQLDYVDSVLMHMPVRIRTGATFPTLTEHDYLPLDLRSVWGAFEDTLDRGFTKAIGVSNFCVKKLQELLEDARVVPAVNQIELHPFCRQVKVRAFCRRKGIHVTGWAPMMAPNTVYGSTFMLDNKVLKEIADIQGKSVAQVCLRWIVDSGCSTVPKSFNGVRQRENLDIFDFTLSDHDHERINNLPLCKCHHSYSRDELKGQYTVFDDQWDDGD